MPHTQPLLCPYSSAYGDEGGGINGSCYSWDGRAHYSLGTCSHPKCPRNPEDEGKEASHAVTAAMFAFHTSHRFINLVKTTQNNPKKEYHGT